MPIPVIAYRVLIASPSDVQSERRVIEKAIHEWNSINAARTEKVLIPVMWETDGIPLQGDRPQGILNEVMVKDCDIIIAAFWTRLGSDTGQESSGTVEEIKYFISQKRPALVYYSKKPLPQDHDPQQWSQLKEFKKSISTGGIQETFTDDSDLSLKILRHLTTILDNIQMSPTVAAKDVRKLIRAGDKAVPKPSKNKSVNSSSSSPDTVILKEHTAKSFVVLGIGKDHEWPSGISGQYISIENGRKAWQFSKKRISIVAKNLGIIAELQGHI